MKLATRPLKPCTFPAALAPTQAKPQCCTLTQPAPRINTKLTENQIVKNWEKLLEPIEANSFPSSPFEPVKLCEKWKEYQGVSNWEGLLDPLDHNLRSEILRYGEIVEAAYRLSLIDFTSSTDETCQCPDSSLFHDFELPATGYKITRSLQATCGIQLPKWMPEKSPNWMRTQPSSSIGYVAVCQDKEEIERLGRRDVVIALRGTITLLEWLENVRANLTQFEPSDMPDGPEVPMVESGFLSLYTSGMPSTPSLQDMVREEIGRILQTYGDEPLSLTITGHSLGAALGILAAYDIKKTFKHSPLVTVIAFGAPRVGNRSFCCHLEQQGTKVLRVVNPDDIFTKMPGFTENNADVDSNDTAGLQNWFQKRAEDLQWIYADAGRELRLTSNESSFLDSINLSKSHDIKTYLELLNDYESSDCPRKSTAKGFLIDHFYREAIRV